MHPRLSVTSFLCLLAALGSLLAYCYEATVLLRTVCLLVTLIAIVLHICLLYRQERKNRTHLSALEHALTKRDDQIFTLEQSQEQQRLAFSSERDRLLRQAQEQTESFRSLLSHDLRMPISIIQGYAELLSEHLVTDSAVQQEYLEKILQRTHYMSEALTKQLQTVRQEQFPPPVCTKLELISLSRQMCHDMRTAAAGRGIAIQMLCMDPAIYIMADAYQLNRIFFNLLENALRYMGREGCITVRLYTQDGMAHVIVKDDGLGLSEEETPHIFDLNFRGSNRQSGQGHGHGLYLVKRSVEAQKGTICASSHPGHGMSIHFTIPLAPAAQTENTTPLSSPTPATDCDLPSLDLAHKEVDANPFPTPIAI